ncbi:LysR substrate-binding domain-containing protein [Scandinavium manionii]|uniref:LysR substrate-binding domain-containing protein n=1 Tax=Scandinavium manionii TaxID=2926520 RepID=UPI00216556CD|nr:LysR substrate-binding domain-containing protein [Scandinavium manionii]MCS2149604.1 LysR substrate-binding domain-containing protein [Scandinavium manionii]MCS2168715.1 LysR substrate-binding domain-containing protein [Scandinavium manionii]
MNGLNTLQQPKATINESHEFDLNLLEVFESVYLFKSVKHAANQLNKSSAAISQSLNKLRLHFSDPLFVRHGMKLTSTTVADNIHAKLHDKYEDLLSELGYFITGQNTSEINVFTRGYSGIRIIPLLGSVIEKHDLQCKILHHIIDASNSSAEELLMLRKVDILFDAMPIHRVDFVCNALWEEELVLVCRQDHPRIGDYVPAEKIREENISMFNVADGLQNLIDKQYRLDLSIRRKAFSLRSNSIFTIAAMTAATDSLAIIPLTLYLQMKEGFSLKVINTDIILPKITLYMIVKKATLENPVIENIIKKMMIHLNGQ